MQEQINLVGDAPDSDKYVKTTFAAFMFWQELQDELQLDIETNVTPFWCTKELKTIQFGQVGFKDGFKHQWVLQWSRLTPEQKEDVKRICEDKRTKLIHNAAFEIVVLRFHGILLCKVFDTILAEKLLTSGLDNEGASLLEVTFKYLGITLNKAEQTTFGDDILTESKVVYAAADVTNLDVIRGFQMPQIEKWQLEKVLALENEAVFGFSDITYNGMELDKEKWRANIGLAQPIVDASLTKLNDWLKEEPFRTKATELGFLSDQDKVLINFNSPVQKKELLTLLFPGIAGASKPILKKYIRDNGPKLSPGDLNILMGMQEQSYQPLFDRLIQDHREWLITHNYLLPANTPSINWNSVPQALPLLQVIHPRLRDLSEESLANMSHPIFLDLAEYKDSLKLITTYGETFLEKHVEPDGKVRTSFNQIVSTGRVSSSKPNMQNIPAKESVGTIYRNAFVCKDDEVFGDSDYTGQELAIIAHISKDPVWFKAITEGKDLHSVCAELVYGKKWLEAKSDGCAYYKMEGGVPAKQKCKCPGHKSLRNSVKSINFGLAYGMSKFKLSAETRSTVQEAQTLIETYFKTFPKIGATLSFLGNFGVQNGYIQTISPYFRKRWFPFWKFARGRIGSHLAGQYDATLGTIERASKNQPIQGTAADMMKVAMVLVRRYIYDNNLQDKVRIVAQVHDQLTTICKKEVADEWKTAFDGLMQEAARVFIPSGILKAETNITPVWTK